MPGSTHWWLQVWNQKSKYKRIPSSCHIETTESEKIKQFTERGRFPYTRGSYQGVRHPKCTIIQRCNKTWNPKKCITISWLIFRLSDMYIWDRQKIWKKLNFCSFKSLVILQNKQNNNVSFEVGLEVGKLTIC